MKSRRSGLSVTERNERMSFSYIFPILMLVAFGIVYHLSAKYTPASLDPLASLTVTYAVGTVVSAVLYYVFNRNGNLIRECGAVNWTAFALGACVVGLETGSILMYRAGWNVNTSYVVHSSILAVLLLFMGALFFGEAITFRKVAGIVLCLGGVILLTV